MPQDTDGLRATFSEAHRRYTGAIHARFKWTGHLFQGRFGAVAMDEEHLIAAARYVALNPVAARLVARAQDWPWGSARAHLQGKDDELVRVAPLLDRVPDFAGFISTPLDDEAARRIERALTIGRPLGSKQWLAAREAELGRRLAPARRGPRIEPAFDALAQARLPGMG